jgi:hypothetical protein
MVGAIDPFGFAQGRLLIARNVCFLVCVGRFGPATR